MSENSNKRWEQHLEQAFGMRLKLPLVMSEQDVTGEERYFVVAEGLLGGKRSVIQVTTTLAEAKTVAERCPENAVSILKQIGYGFREE